MADDKNLDDAALAAIRAQKKAMDDGDEELANIMATQMKRLSDRQQKALEKQDRDEARKKKG